MDPVFGLPVVKESKAMEEARNRNRTQERLLCEQISNLHSKLQTTTSRLIQHKNTALELWNTIHPPGPQKKAVCPSGLTNHEKSAYKHMRKSGPPSMSLQEFDKRMEEFRNDSVKQRGKVKDEDAHRLRRRRNSEMLPMKQTQGTRRSSIVVDEEEQPTRSPLLKCKHRMKEALERSETSDVRFKDKIPSDQHSARRHSSVLPHLPVSNRTNSSESQVNSTSRQRRNSVAFISLETPREERKLSSSSEEGKKTLDDVKTLMGQLAITST